MKGPTERRFRPSALAVLWLLAACALPARAETRPEELRPAVRQIEEAYERSGRDAAREIVPFLEHRDLSVRSHAVRRLVDLGAAAVDPLIEALGRESTRWLASGALINIGPDAIHGTVGALESGNPVVRRNALFILRQLDARDTYPEIRKATLDPDPSVRIMAIQTVALFGGEDALQLVLKQVDVENDAIREAAIGALRYFGKDALPALTSLLSYGNPDVRAQAVKALGNIGTPEAGRHILKALGDESALVRYSACNAIAETGDPSTLPSLILLLEDRDSDVREAASEACARFPDAAWRFLAPKLKEGTTLQKIGAATVARKARYRPAVADLGESMRDPESEVRMAATAALMAVGDPSTVEILVAGLQDPQIRWLCILALRQFGDKNITPLLRRSGDPELDYWKQFVLEGMGDKALEGCLEALKTETELGTKIATLCTMRQIKDVRAAYPLINLLGDEKIGYVAQFVLVQMGEVAVDPLLVALQDERPQVRAQAARTLGEIGFGRVVQPLRGLLSDPEPSVRSAAEQAMRKITGETAPLGSSILPFLR